MISLYRRALPLTFGVFLSIMGIAFLLEFVRSFDIYDLGFTMEIIHLLVIGFVSMFIGVPLFFLGLEKIENKNG